MKSVRHELQHGWEFKATDDPEDGWLPVAQVPSAVHTDLLANKRIPDPFLDLNELAVQWVADKDWVYRTRFPTPPGFSANGTSDLVFEGLDTLASVTLNGVEVLRADNMFIPHRAGVKDHLKTPGQEGDNELVVVFESALRRGRELVDQHAHEHRFLARQTEQGRLPLRKAQYHWGWDWGPILVTAGIWRPAYLEHFEARVSDVWAEYTLSPDLKFCHCTIRATTEAANSTEDTIQLAILSPDESTVFSEQGPADEKGSLESTHTITDPQLWYPFMHGAQPLYNVTATLRRGRDSSSRELDTKTKRIGFRRAELVQDPDAFGKSFYFRINNIDVFAGGSCFIPADSFLSSIDAERYRSWMRLMRDGNQVMLRIWGGGVYEDDALLDAADEMGVLIWHDFAFACASYPTYPSFLANVEVEARHNVRRMRGRPSMVIWAGNNEDYQVQERYGLEYRYDEDKDPQSWLKSSFPARYIYEYLLPKIVEEEDPGCLYHPSSPWGDGKRTADPTVGDLHQWNIWHGTLEKYQDAAALTGRFVSEFGMEGHPHLSTIEAYVTQASQRVPGSQVLDFRNKAFGAGRRLWAYMAENMPLPANYEFANFVHQTQIVQAEAMSNAYKAWRRDWKTAAEGRKCGGVLVWQINDAYPTVSWAVVDYYLVPKPAYYAIKRALRELDVGVKREYHEWTKCHSDPVAALRDVRFDVWVSSARAEAVEGEVVLRFVSVKTGKDVRDSRVEKVVVQANATTEVLNSVEADVGGAETFDVDSDAWDPFVIHASLVVAGEAVASETDWPQPLKYLGFEERGVKVRKASDDSVVVSADRPVKGFVIEEKRGMKVDDNGFDLVPGEEKITRVSGIPLNDLKYRWLGASQTYTLSGTAT